MSIKWDFAARGGKRDSLNDHSFLFIKTDEITIGMDLSLSLELLWVEKYFKFGIFAISFDLLSEVANVFNDSLSIVANYFIAGYL